MKKYIFILIAALLAFFIVFKLVGAIIRPQGKTVLGRDLLDTAIGFHIKQHPKDKDDVKKLVEKARNIYSPQAFQDFISTKDNDGWSILHHYAANGDQKNMRWLLSMLKDIYGDDPQTLYELLFQKDNYGRTPLYLSITRKKPGIVMLLLEKAQEFFGKDKDLFYTYTQEPDTTTQWTPLMLAAYLNDYESMEQLLKAQVNVFKRDNEKRLHRNIRFAHKYADKEGSRLIRQHHVLPEDINRKKRQMFTTSVG